MREKDSEKLADQQQGLTAGEGDGAFDHCALGGGVCWLNGDWDGHLEADEIVQREAIALYENVLDEVAVSCVESALSMADQTIGSPEPQNSENPESVDARLVEPPVLEGGPPAQLVTLIKSPQVVTPDLGVLPTMSLSDTFVNQEPSPSIDDASIPGLSPGHADQSPPTVAAAGWAGVGWSEARAYAWRGLRYAGWVAAGYLALILLLVPVFRLVDPPGSSLMLFQFLGGGAIDRRWVPLDQISPHLTRAVVVAEDDSFCRHSGVDFGALQDAIEASRDGLPRGASTISMQVTKNMFLWSARSVLRKVFEIPLTLYLELIWPKSRIIEVYLNIAEWGDGVFGAEAAARYHFNKSAANLSQREAALLAASLPNPFLREAGDPSPRTAKKAGVIQARVNAYGAVASCVLE